MLRHWLHLGLGVLLIGAALSAQPAHAQDKDDLDEFRRLRRLETPLDFWNAVQFEIDLGKPDIAARYLRGLVSKKPSDKDVYTILDRDGITPILKLRNVRVWSTDKKENDQAKKDVEDLITLATEANKRRLADAGRIRELIGQLQQGTPEEKTYATRELYKIGAPAVPHFIEAHGRAREPADRLAVVDALKKMPSGTLQPLLAALDSKNTTLKLDILDILRARHSAAKGDLVPNLWYVAESKTEPEEVRKRAAKLLADLLELPSTKLPSAKAALTREAERYYKRDVSFGDPKAVTVWRWDDGKLVQGWPGAATVTATQAEHYYGQRFARQALSLDPDYKPAQLIALSLAIDKGMEKSGPVAALSKTSPETAELLAKASPELVLEVLDKALTDKRTNVVLAAARALGERAEARAKRPLKSGEPGLVRALYYPDARVQMAAATALLSIPGAPAPRTAARIVEILTKALSPASAYRPGKKILVALTDADLRDRVRQTVLDVGAQPVLVANGKDAMRRLRADGEIEAILLDSTLPFPGLANLLAQMRQDVDAGQVPILLAAVPETRTSHDAASRYRRLKARIDTIKADTRAYRSLLQQFDRDEATEKADAEKEQSRTRRLTPDDRIEIYKRIEDKFNRERADQARKYVASVMLLKELPELEREAAKEIERYDLESQIREAALERFVQGYDQIRVVHASLLTDARALEANLLASIGAAAEVPTAAEKRDVADLAMEWLANLAEGKPEGYDVRPAADAILAALRGKELGPAGQLAGIRAATKLDGSAAQAALAAVALDGARAANLRLAAAKGLIGSIQKHGARLPATDITALHTLAGQAGVDPKLKDQLDHLFGALRPSERATGERLRDFKPKPPGGAALPPPGGKDKDKDKDME